MKKYIFLMLTLNIYSVIITHAQDSDAGGIPKVEVKNGITYWYGISVNQVVNKSDLIFEGRILTDSAFFLNSPGDIFTAHRVLVLKQFKGNFKSDIITVVTNGGKMILHDQWEAAPVYTKVGNEAVFFATNSTKVEMGGSDPNTFDLFYGPGVSYITVCDKKDVAKEVYEPIQAVTGQKYIEIHPNNCKGQQSQQK